MTIDTIGERYGLLPSEVLRRATTLDLLIVDTAIGYRNSLHDRANKKVNPPAPESYSQEHLLEILEETRGQSRHA
jgi:hypothetical protein